MARTRLLVLAALLALPAAASAQAAAPEREAILKAVQTTFDGMRTHDTVLLKTAIQSDASFLNVARNREGKTVVRRSVGQDFINAVGKGGEPWNETITNPVVHQDGDFAAVWAPYTFKLGDKPSHCGHDLITLAKTDGQWKVVAIADTQKREGCQF